MYGVAKIGTLPDLNPPSSMWGRDFHLLLGPIAP